MVVDTSALLAVLFAEADGDDLLARIVEAPRRIMSAANALEAGILADHHPKPNAGGDLDDLMATLGIDVEPVTAAQVRLARRAYRVYGRGNHPAALNFGDCFAYALAKASGLPLLFKGGDFGRTDVTPAA